MEAFTGEKRDAVLRGITEAATKRRGILRDKAIQMVTMGRPDAKDELLNRISDAAFTLRPFSRRLRWNFASAGSPSAVLGTLADEAQWCKPFPYGKADQPVDDGILFINNISIEGDGTLKLNTVAEMRRQYGLLIHHDGEKKDRFLPLADALATAKVYAIDAGNNAGAVVAGSHVLAGPDGGAINLDEDETIIVKPKDSKTGLELVRLPEYSAAPTLTGETVALYFYVTFRGLRLATQHGNR